MNLSIHFCDAFVKAVLPNLGNFYCDEKVYITKLLIVIIVLLKCQLIFHVVPTCKRNIWSELLWKDILPFIASPLKIVIVIIFVSDHATNSLYLMVIKLTRHFMLHLIYQQNLFNTTVFFNNINSIKEYEILFNKPQTKMTFRCRYISKCIMQNKIKVINCDLI